MGNKGDASARKVQSPFGGASVSNIAFHSPVDSSGRNPVRGNDDPQGFGGSHFMLQGMHVTTSQPADWAVGPDARNAAGYELTGIIFF